MALDGSLLIRDDLELNWPACSSCWNNTDETGFCYECNNFWVQWFKSIVMWPKETEKFNLEVSDILSQEWEVEWSINIQITPEWWMPEQFKINYKITTQNNKRELSDEFLEITSIEYNIEWDTELLFRVYTDEQINNLIRKAFYWKN